MAKRQVSDKSLANLALGRKGQGKLRRNYTLLPETIDWLDRSGNASRRLDELVARVKSKDLVPALSDPNEKLVEINEVLEDQVKGLRKQIAELHEDLERCVRQKIELQQQHKTRTNAAANILENALALDSEDDIKAAIKQALKLLQ